MDQFLMVRWLLIAFFFPVLVHGQDDSQSNFAPAVRDFFRSYCFECHDDSISIHDRSLSNAKVSGTAKNEEPADAPLGATPSGFSLQELIRLDDVSVSPKHWERVLDLIKSGAMPPDGSDVIPQDDRAEMIAWIDRQLTESLSIGGTPPRRLNRDEYQRTIQSLFNLQDFNLPPGFPADRPLHGFTNLGEGLVVSPQLFEAYSESARQVADELFPPPRKVPLATTEHAGPNEMVISYSSSKVVGDAMRLGMKCDPIQRSCTWPSRIEAKVAGVYGISVRLSAFRPRAEGPPMVAKVLARDVSSADGVSHGSLRLLQEIVVTKESPEIFEFEAILHEGQTLVLHWANAELDSDQADKAALRKFFEAKGQENPRYLAAWHAMLNGEQGQGFRGGIGWERVKSHLSNEDLPLIDAEQQEALLKKIMGNPVLYAETVVFDVFENGPALEVHGLKVSGPKEIVEGPKELTRKRLRARFLGGSGASEEAIRRFLKRAFRRPVDEKTAQIWIGLFNEHLEDGHSEDEAMHLLIRHVLISPRFLYRCIQDGPLDDYDLATRLSYFLTQRPPDDRLIKKVERLSDPAVLRDQAERLLPSSAGSSFVVDFTEQWLGTRLLADIMPDGMFKFTKTDQKNAKLEVENFFAEILRENRPLRDFIDPDFTWTSPRIAKNIYELNQEFDKQKVNNLQRISLPRGGRFGGLLGQSAVMMATANGVDTQPVLRGVWVLDNLLGSPPPPPPNAVPPITPDTNGAKTPRELLTLHTEDMTCAMCHHRIDPLGIVLENFDPVGRWRDRWPNGGMPIDSRVVMPDGTELKDVVDLKKWMLLHLDQFGLCVAEKLMTYATGRQMNYRERSELEGIVRHHLSQDAGFRDLVLDLIASPVFAAK